MVEFAFLTKVLAGLKRVKRAWWIGDGRGLSRERGADALPQDALRSRKPGPENGSLGVEDAGGDAPGRAGRGSYSKGGLRLSSAGGARRRKPWPGRMLPSRSCRG